MKKIVLSALTLAMFATAQAQTTETVSIGAQGSTDVWYSLENGEQGTAPANNWDIAFEIGGMTAAAVRVNGAKGVEIYHYGAIADYANVDTNGFSWDALINSNVSWSDGALKQLKDPDDQFDYGFGAYNSSAHQVDGTKSFIVKLNDTTYKKLKIVGLVNYATPPAFKFAYVFKYADLDGNNEVTDTIKKEEYDGKNYVFFSMKDNKVLDREPVTIGKWDLLFTEYMEDSVPVPPQFGGGFAPHSLSGVLSNPKIQVAKVDGVSNPDTYMDWFGQDYTTNINAIGGLWKSFDMTGPQSQWHYEVNDSLVYFVKDQDGNIWKLIFKGYGGSQTGDMTFIKQKISTASVNDFEKPSTQVVVYPNPAKNYVSLLLNNLMNKEAQISIMNISGQVVYTKMVSGDTNFEVKNITISQLEAGVYFVNVLTNSQRITKKLIIQ